MRIRTVGALAATVRGTRQERGWSQGDLARRAQVSRQWINEFEAGKETAAIGTVLRVLFALGLRLDAVEDDPEIATAGGIDLDAHLASLHDG
ncbi:MAG: helix-turn-helix domain-containing protein [Chloroflexota bacterium]